ncbi:hypothetical protein [Fibrella forsythiae]|uniref:Uncharacterized protein n=1 Tax=Fibrella forsythiae TaxID=2817061 RepID=A0ABS3JPL7_9BACT|nr:hypothetical protein [Fibrella forsythiae]MBO0950867.1 hypothetical protein [Fibrella forsythiae]
MQLAHDIYNAANTLGKVALVLAIHSAWFFTLYVACLIWKWVSEVINPRDYDDSNY